MLQVDFASQILFQSPWQGPQASRTVPLVPIKEGGPAIDLFSKLAQKGDLNISGPIDGDMQEKITAQFLDLAAGEYCDRGYYNLFIDSPGGSVAAGYAMIDCIDTLGKPVQTICNGTAASMGALMLACGTPGCRFIHQRSRVMIHQPSLNLNAASYTFLDLQIITEQLQQTRENLARTLCERCVSPTGERKTLDWMLTFLEHDRWFTAQRAVEFGIVDRIIEPKTLTREQIEAAIRGGGE